MGILPKVEDEAFELTAETNTYNDCCSKGKLVEEVLQVRSTQLQHFWSGMVKLRATTSSRRATGLWSPQGLKQHWG
jgi:hypothetical protein